MTNKQLKSYINYLNYFQALNEKCLDYRVEYPTEFEYLMVDRINQGGAIEVDLFQFEESNL
jgi:hypothetical protein